MSFFKYVNCLTTILVVGFCSLGSALYAEKELVASWDFNDEATGGISSSITIEADSGEGSMIMTGPGGTNLAIDDGGTSVNALDGVAAGNNIRFQRGLRWDGRDIDFVVDPDASNGILEISFAAARTSGGADIAQVSYRIGSSGDFVVLDDSPTPFPESGSPESNYQAFTYILPSLSDFSDEVTIRLTFVGGGAGSSQGNRFVMDNIHIKRSAPEPLALTGTPPAEVEINEFFSFTPEVSGGFAPYTFTLSGSLPEGVSFDSSDGSIAGTPVLGGVFEDLIIEVEDGESETAQIGPFTLTVTGLFATAEVPVTGRLNEPYAGFTVQASGGAEPYDYALLGDWPAGISVDSGSGEVSGTPTESGVFTNLSVRVTDNDTNVFDLPAFDLIIEPNPGNLYLWVNADSLNFNMASGSPVSSWPDLSGNNRDLEQTDPGLQPTLVKNAFAGRSAVRFTPDDVLSFSDATLDPQDLTLIAVSRSDSSSGNLLQHGSSSPAFSLSQSSSEVQFASSSTLAGQTEELTLISLVSDQDGATLYIDGLEVDSLEWSSPSSSETLEAFVGEVFSGDIFSLRIYTDSLSSLERQAVEFSLLDYYGIGVDLEKTFAFADYAVEGFPATFFVDFRNSLDKPVVFDPALYSVDWTSGPNENPTLSSAIDGQILLLSYTPDDAGDDVFSITYDGDPIGNSPFTLTVEPFVGYTWMGPGGSVTNPTSGDWNVASHWFENVVPPSSDETVVRFPLGEVDYTITNDLSNLILNRIVTFSLGQGSADIIFEGNPITFEGDDKGIQKASSGILRIANSLSAEGVLTIYNESTSNGVQLNTSDEDNSIDVDEIFVQSGIINIRGTHDGLGSISIADGAKVFSISPESFTMAGPFIFEGPNSLSSGRGNRGWESAGWHSLTLGAGHLTRDGGGTGGIWWIDTPNGEDYTYSGTVGTLSLGKRGQGTQRFSGNFSATGNSNDQIRLENGLLHFTESSTIAGASREIRLDGGVLRIDGVAESGEGLINVNSSAFLSGSGTINRPVMLTSGANLTAGTHEESPGTLTFGETVTFSENGFNRIYWKRDEGDTADLFVIEGDLTFEDGNDIQLNLNNLSSDELQSMSFPLFEVQGDLTGFDPGAWNIIAGNTGWEDAVVFEDGNTIYIGNLVSIEADNLTQAFTGSPLSPDITVSPAFLDFDITYRDSEDTLLPGPPADPGVYSVTVEVNDSSMSEPFPSRTFTFTITEQDAEITLFEIDPDPETDPFVYQFEEGTPRELGATTDPADLSFEILYSGSSTPPTNAGTYNVTATITDPNFSGSTSTTLRILGTPIEIGFVENSLLQLFDPNRDPVANPYLPEVEIESPHESADFFILFNGQTTPPSSAGNFQVQAFVDEASLEGESDIRTFRLVQPTFAANINFLEGTDSSEIDIGAVAPPDIPGSFTILTDTSTLATGSQEIEVEFSPNESSFPVVVYTVPVSVAGTLYWNPAGNPTSGNEDTWNNVTPNWNTGPGGSGDQIAWIPNSLAVFDQDPGDEFTVRARDNITVRRIVQESGQRLTLTRPGGTNHIIDVTDAEDSLQMTTNGSEMRVDTSLRAQEGLTISGSMGGSGTRFFEITGNPDIRNFVRIPESSQGRVDINNWDSRGSGGSATLLEMLSGNITLRLRNEIVLAGIEAPEPGLQIVNSPTNSVDLILIVPSGNSYNMAATIDSQQISLIKRGGGTQILSGSNVDWRSSSGNYFISIENGVLFAKNDEALGRVALPIRIGGTTNTATLKLSESITVEKEDLNLLGNGRISGKGTVLNSPRITGTGSSLAAGFSNETGTLSFGNSTSPTGLYVANRTSGLLKLDEATSSIEMFNSEVNANFNDVAYGDGVFVAVGDLGAVFTSIDGVEWTKRSAGTNQNLRAIAYGNGTFVAVGTSGRRIVSTDSGETWDEGPIGAFVTFNDVMYNGSGTFYAVGANRQIRRSNDGINWNAVTAEFPEGFPSNTVFHSIVWVPDDSEEEVGFPGMYVLGGVNGTVLYSTSLQDWEYLNPPTFGGPQILSLTPNTFDVGEPFVIGTTNNGETFSATYSFEENTETGDMDLILEAGFSSLASGSFYSITATPQAYYTVGNSGQIYQSFDGEEWSDLWDGDDPLTSSHLRGIAYDNQNEEVLFLGRTLGNVQNTGFRWRWDNETGDRDLLQVHGDLTLESVNVFQLALGVINSSSGETSPDPDTWYTFIEVVDGEVFSDGEILSDLNDLTWSVSSGNSGWKTGSADIDFRIEEDGNNRLLQIRGIGDKIVSLAQESPTAFRLQTPALGIEVDFVINTTSGLQFDHFGGGNPDLFFFDREPDVLVRDPWEFFNDFAVDMRDDDGFGDPVGSAVLEIRPQTATTLWNFIETDTIDFTVVEGIDQVEFDEDNDTVTIEVTGRPDAPSNLDVTDVTASTVSLAWDDNSSVEDGFIIQRKIDGNAWSTAVDLTEATVDLESFTDTDLEEGTTYVYRVKAYNRPYAILTIDWVSDPSNEITVTTEGQEPLNDYEQWLTDNGLNPGDPGTGMTESFRNDGITNLLKYALAMDVLSTDRLGLPELSQSGGRMRLTFTRNLEAVEVRFIVQASEDLVNWSSIATLQPGASNWTLSGGATRSSTDLGNEVYEERITDGSDIISQPRRFLRLEVQWDP
ncbi:MAG: fibronectin type III domain-containing protein [Opitutales bacterium]|nr:fibronectin type III domain-containing protein [Opitutales bacterium]MCH8541583.1 MBG domain-containing protein [Opitutales bacterium]